MARSRPVDKAALRSLSSRLVIGVLSLLLVGGIAVAFASFAYGRQAAREAYDRLLLGAASDIADSVSVADGAPVAQLPVTAFQLLALAPEDRIAYAVYGPDGTLLTGHDFITLPLGEGTARRDRGPMFFEAEMQGEIGRFVTVSRPFAERDFAGEVYVTVGQTQRARNDMALSLTRNALLVAVLAGAALMILALLVIRSAMRPLNQLAEGLLDRDPYDLTPMDSAVPAEIAGMIRAMNRFMWRLDRQVGAMRNLISDTAHQLRTPVAAIRAQVELAIEEDDPKTRAQMLDRLSRRSQSLGALLDQMLSRALVIHRTDSAPRNPVDLRDIALEVFEAGDHELLMPGSEVELVIGPDPVVVLADEMSLTEAVRNMFNNALRHGIAPMRIGAETVDGEAVIWVEDAGSGPSKEVLSRMGKRFERNAASKGKSAGLGLSIVQAVAEAFEGRVTMGAGENGFRVSLYLPQEEDA